MCKICKTKPGDIKIIGKYTLKQVVGGKVIGTEDLVLEYYISDDDIPEPYLVSDYVIHRGYECVEKALVETPIKYCPFCGRKLYEE